MKLKARLIRPILTSICLLACSDVIEIQLLKFAAALQRQPARPTMNAAVELLTVQPLKIPSENSQLKIPENSDSSESDDL